MVEVKAITPVIAALVLIITVVSGAIILYVWFSGYVTENTEEKPSEIFTTLAKVEHLRYYYENNTPILETYIRNIGSTKITVDRAYLEGSFIVGYPRKYNITTRVISLNKHVTAQATTRLSQKSREVRYWKNIATNLPFPEKVWGGDKWTYNIQSNTLTRTQEGLIKTYNDLSWQFVKTSNAQGSYEDRGSYIEINCKSNNRQWAKCSYKASLDDLNPPFVVEAKVEKANSGARYTNVGVYVTSRSQHNNPYSSYPFYEFGVFDWWGRDVLEARLRNKNGDSKYFPTDVESSIGHVILVVNNDREGEIHGFKDDSHYGSASISYNVGTNTMKYIWLTVETTKTSTMKGYFYKDYLKIYRRPYFTVELIGLGGSVEAYRFSLLIENTVSLTYVKEADEPSVIVDPRDDMDFYMLWLEDGYPFDVKLSLDVLNKSVIHVEPEVSVNIDLVNVVLKILNPPGGFDSSKINVVVDGVSVDAEWKLRYVRVKNGEISVGVDVLVKTVNLNLKIRYNGNDVSTRSVEVPIFREYSGSHSEPYSGGDKVVTVPVTVDYTYDSEVIVDVPFTSKSTVGIGVGVAHMSLGTVSGNAEVMKPFTQTLILNNVYGGDKYTIRWQGSSWSADRTFSGRIFEEQFNPGWKSRWILKEKSLDASKYSWNGWGGIRAKRIDSSTDYPSASLVSAELTLPSTYVLEGKIRKLNSDNYYYSGVFIADDDRANPWEADNWVMCRIRRNKDGGVQVGVSKGGEKLWSTKISRTTVASFVMYVDEGDYVEYWLWDNAERTGKTYHGVISNAPSISRGYIHLSHTYYEKYGSTSDRYSIFDSVVLYKGTEISFKLEPSSKAYVEKIVFKSENDQGLYSWYPEAQDEELTLNLRDWYMRNYWLSHGCPLPLKLEVSGERSENVGATVDVSLDLNVRVFANFTITTYDREALGETVKINVEVVDVDASISNVQFSGVGEYVKARVTVDVRKIRVHVKVLVKNEVVYDSIIDLDVNKQYTFEKAEKAHSDVNIVLNVPVYVEKDITFELSGGHGALTIDMASEASLMIPPKQTKLVEFVLDKPLKKGHRYIVKVAFKEGIEARSEIVP